MTVHGRPMCYWPMSAARSSPSVIQSFISTDDDDIRLIGESLQHIYLSRPPELASSSALGEDVFSYAYKQAIDFGIESHDYVLLLFCNAPTVNHQLIERAAALLDENPAADSVVTSSIFNMWSPLRARQLTNDGFLEPFVDHAYFGDPATLSCDRDSQGNVHFANMSLSLVRPGCLLQMQNGLLPQKWMGRKILPLIQDFGCDVDFEWQLPLVEAWLDNPKNHHEHE